MGDVNDSRRCLKLYLSGTAGRAGTGPQGPKACGEDVRPPQGGIASLKQEPPYSASATGVGDASTRGGNTATTKAVPPLNYARRR